MDHVTISFPVIEVTQPIGTFYVGVINAVDLFFTSWADVRNLENRDLDLYIGIQRPLSDTRLKELVAYVKNIDATFPTGVILSTTASSVVFDKAKMMMTVDRNGDVFKILDGQHRVMAFKEYAIADTRPEFEIPVMIFVDMDVEDQAQVFATINLAQTKVNKSLAYDLFAFAKEPSPQKTAHQVARLMNRHEQSPYLNRVKILGRADLGGEVLTQAAIVDQLLPLITEDKRSDRDIIKRGGWPVDYGLGAKKKCVFRHMWCIHKDEQIGITMLRFFSEVSARWPYAWNTAERGYILSRTNGFRAFMTLLRDYLVGKGIVEVAPTREEFDLLLKKVKLVDEDFVSDKFLPGSGGQAALENKLREALI